MKSVAQDVIMISNSKEDPSLKNEGMVDNSSVRVCHTKGQSSRHAMWASMGLKVCMFLERGLQRVVNLKKGQQRVVMVDVWTRPNEGKQKRH